MPVKSMVRSIKRIKENKKTQKYINKNRNRVQAIKQK